MTDGYKIRPSMIRKNNHKLDNQGWLGRPASAVVVKAARDIDFEKCRFQHLGSTGIDYEWATDGGHINGCLFRDIAGNGIVAVSYTHLDVYKRQIRHSPLTNKSSLNRTFPSRS